MHSLPVRSLVFHGVLLGLLASCSDGVDGLGTVRRRAVLDTTAVDFGVTMLGTPVERTFLLRNDGEGAFHARLELGGDTTSFVLPWNSVTVDSQGTEVRVHFLPLEAGLRQASITIRTEDEAGTEFTVSLRGEGQGAPNCDDANPCTLDLWDGTGCTHTPVATTCDDGNSCTVGDRCVDGACSGAPMQCDDGVDCTVDTCQEGAGCVYLPRAEACDDGNPCTADACLPSLGCEHPVAPNGTLCGPPACDAMPMCVSGECRALPAPDGFPCEDGDPCTLGDRCVTGTCEKGLGNPMGVSDPVVVAMPRQLAEGGMVEPTQVLGILPLGNGSARVLWRTRVVTDADCTDRDCRAPRFCEVPAAFDGFALKMGTVSSEGVLSDEVTLTAPASSRYPLNAQAAPTDTGLAVLMLMVGGGTCCAAQDDEDFCPPESPSFELFHLAADGAWSGPHHVAVLEGAPESFVDAAPLAVGARGMEVAVVTSSPVDMLCTGACPPGVRLTVTTVDLGAGSAETSRGSVAVMAVQQQSMEAHVHLGESGVTVAFMERLGYGPATVACGPYAAAGHNVHVLRAPRAASLLFTEVPLPVAHEDVAGVALADGTLGPAVMLGTHGAGDVEPCDCAEDPTTDEEPCAPTCGCGLRPAVGVMEGGAFHQQQLEPSEAGPSPLVRMSGASAFGRAVAVAVQQDGTVSLLSPALGALPAVSATLRPDPTWGVMPDTMRSPVLARDGAQAWLGATVVSTLSLVPMRGAAIVRAGCGVQANGTVLGFADAGTPGTDAGAEDAGVNDAGANDADAGDAPVMDAGSTDAADADGGTGGADGGAVDAEFLPPAP